ncbi:PREDICTED: MAG2-interacting protein 2-like [Camelina sativa]|uniref:MAG2-interacting protein 2-like n=1 Tax=Camelina sativa TaxID=90675 RepID=A0ABM1QUS8_CAMSA|nr:PREDICTED: MAG2-interacting protein 2-like [Camelina sativa]
METPGRKVLYEIRHHASLPYVPRYPPLPQADGTDSKGGLRSLVSIRGVSQLKEKWSEYWNPRKTNKPVSLFISPRGELVAVTSGNHVTILRKDDDYRKPCGSFTSNISGSFTSGVWSEKHDVLGLVDDSETLFFIRTNGEEISQVTKRNLKVSASVLGLIEDDCGLQPSCLCSFSVLTSDGLVHHVEISREPSASAVSKHASNNVPALRKQFPNHVFCFDYHPDLSFLLIVGSTAGISSTGSSGSSCISLWRKCQNLGLELLSTTKFEGVYCETKDDQLAYPKILISPQGSHVASLDSNGCMHLFQLDKARLTLSYGPSEDSSDSLKPDKSLQSWKESLRNVVDFTWWSDHALTILKRSGNISIFDISRCVIVQEDATNYSMPVVERVRRLEGHIFLLESSTQEAKSALAKVDKDPSELHHTSEHSMLWRLISFTEKTIPEMYKILVEKSHYQEALDFADSHGLDRDEVFKSRWLNSEKMVSDVSMILSKIKDKAFVLSECLNRIGPTEDSMKALLAHGVNLTNHYVFAKSEDQESQPLWESRLARLRLLQFSERLDTYLGISMGRYSVQDYRKFRSNPINQAAIALAESGRIGALNLLFKRHPYSLASFMLQILAAIPETVPVETYAHLLPGKSPPTSMAVREEDWVECEKMVRFINKLPENRKNDSQIQTEPIVRRCLGYNWPSSEELAAWYKNRARDIDSSTGLLDNCTCLIDIAWKKGMSELEQFHEDLSYLHQIIYSDEIGGEICFSLSLVGWEHLSNYEKFKMMLEGIKTETVVRRLHDKAIPFMQKRFLGTNSRNEESFLVKWLKEMAAKNEIDLCSKVIEEGCMDLYTVCFFKDEVQVVDCALQCLYLCKVTDKWNVMATMLSKLPKINDIVGEDIQKRLKLAEGHIEAGRLLEIYQVPKPINYFLEVHLDEKGVKQILRLILSKFVRRQPGRSDNDWACMWRDLRQLQEKAFSFLDLEFVLTEFCRGLLKAGKFSLARNYLKGTGSVALPSEKAESLVINAAKEYFFSAPSLASEEIWKARECLNIFSSSRTVKAEADIIDAVTVRLPDLGVSLLPVQFKQVNDPMEIIKMAITGHPGAYLHVEELIEVAKLLGLNSSEEISSVEEAIAREAAVAGDLQVAFDLCLVLTKKGHGPIWDLGAAIARGPALEHMDISSRKQLLGFALGHCDDESISELLHAWKDLDLQGQCETLGMLSETDSPEFHKMGGVSCLRDFPQMLDGLSSDQQLDFDRVKDTLSCVAKDLPVDNSMDLESLLKENGKLLSFAASHLPWLLKLGRNRKLDKRLTLDSIPGKQFVSVKATALVTILSWLAKNGFAPKDELIAMITDSIIDHPVTKEEDIIGCSFLLNLVDASNAVEVIEKQLRIRGNYQEIRSIMSLGMIYSLLHDSGVECTAPIQRRELLRKNFERKQTESLSDDMRRIDKLQSTFWKEWKHKLEEKMHDADRSRILERIIPGVETERFLSHDIEYIKVAVFSLIESVKSEKKLILKDVLTLADTYGLNQSEVILRYLSSILRSEIWTNEDITAEIIQVKEEILLFASDTIQTISTIVYPAVSGLNKQRIAYIYSLLSECYCHLELSKEASLLVQPHGSFAGLSNMYNVLKQECSRVSFITDLDFKNIAALGGLNFDSFNNEVHAHINEMNLEALAKMVETLTGFFMENSSDSLISWQDVYKQYIMDLLDTLESRRDLDFGSAESFQGFLGQLEQTYDHSRVYVRILEPLQAVEILKRHFTLVLPPNDLYVHIPDSSTWQECLILLINFWIRLADEMQEVKSSTPNLVENLILSPECISSCLTVLIKLVMDDSLSPSQAWAAILVYLKSGLAGDCATEIFNFCRAMVFSGCGFGPISDVFSDLSSRYPTAMQDLPHLYLSILEPILQNLVSGAHETQNLYRLLSSLSNLEGNLEELKRVRLVVWEQLVIFSENLELPSQVRVYSLELMQFISGKNIKGSSSELQSNVMPWDGSAELLSSMQKTEATLNQALPDQADGSSRLTNTLVALKSSQIAVVSIAPGLEITPEDLSSVETSVSCFSKLSSAVTTASQAEALLAILEGWEELFEAKKAELLPSNEATDQGSDWSNDDWNDGWETFQEPEPMEKEKKEYIVSAHPLHSCWLDILRKYIALCMPENVLRLIDGSLQKPEEVLLEENEAESLAGILASTDPFLALKISLLLPYERIRSQCLNVVEEQLKQAGIPELSSQSHHEVLLLVIYSGTLSTIISDSCYGSVFSFLCYLIGKLSREFQEERIRQADTRESNASSKKRFMSCFGELLFPCFVAELVKANQQILAGFLVTKFMHSNPSLSLINVAEASLRRYLEKQLESLEHLDDSADNSELETLKNTISSLRGTLKEVIRPALVSLSTCTNSR